MLDETNAERVACLIEYRQTHIEKFSSSFGTTGSQAVHALSSNIKELFRLVGQLSRISFCDLPRRSQRVNNLQSAISRTPFSTSVPQLRNHAALRLHNCNTLRTVMVCTRAAKSCRQSFGITSALTWNLVAKAGAIRIAEVQLPSIPDNTSRSGKTAGSAPWYASGLT